MSLEPPRIALVPIRKEPAAARILYALLRERSAEDDRHTNISHRKLPAWEQHIRFIESRPYRFWFLIRVGAEYVGSITATRRNEIGIVLARAWRGKGIGTDAVHALTSRYKPLRAIPSERIDRWLANINPENAASVRMFVGLGFERVQVTYAL